MKQHYSGQKISSRALRILLFSLAMLWTYVPMSHAQSFTVTGKVTDESGSPMPGVSVSVKGTTIGTASSTDGNYRLNVPSSSSTLVFSFIGMGTQEIGINGRTVVNAVMEPDATSMEDVVVIGYGSQKKSHLTGSVVTVSSEDIKRSTTSNLSQALVGKLPGIITQQATGAPGADNVTILVRGYSSFQGGASPLILVDGVERSMSHLDMNEVESVTVLKDAASYAVYGMKGADGVILVTTKKGRQGQALVNYQSSVTLSNMTTFPKFMNGTQYMQYYNMAKELDNLDPLFTEAEIAATYNGDPTDGYENTNWQSPLYRTAVTHKHNLSVTGGTEKVQYYVSGGFQKHNGIMDGNYNRIGNFRSNIDANPHKNVRLSFNVAGRVQDYKRPGGYSYDNQAAYNLFHLMMYSLPFAPKEYEGYPTSAYRVPANAANPEYGSYNSGFSKTRNVTLETSFNLEYSLPVKGLKVGIFGSWDSGYGSGKTFSYGYQVMAYNFNYDRTDPNAEKYILRNSANLMEEGNLYQSKQDNHQVVLRPSISYSNRFGKHDISGVVFYEQITGNSSVMTGGRMYFDLLDLPELNLGGTTAGLSNSGSSGKTANAGYVGRLSYAYDNKYLAEVSARYDGSYLFHKDHRWGFFPSLSLGWIMSNEEFFQDAIPKIEFFKLRASIGVLGRNNLNPFLYRKIYGFNGNSVAFGYPPASQGSISNTVSYPMESLTWERSRTTNVGFDLSVWNGLLGVEFDFFYKYTKDILQDIQNVYPPSLGGHFPTTLNTGTLDNRGFELVLTHRNQVRDFYYNIKGNVTFARNRILSKDQEDNILPWKSVLGSSVGSIWGLKAIGLYQTEEEIANAPAPVGDTPRLGDIMYADINGDGRITSDDYVKIARSRLPEMMFSMTFDFYYKGVDLNIMLQGAALTDKMLQAVWDNGATDATPLTRPWYAGYDNAPLYLVENSWRPDNTNATYPRLSTIYSTNNSSLSSFWKRNGSYLRLKNVELGYSFPKKWMDKASINSLRVYVSGYNLLTATEFKYTDPESMNVVTGYYPQQRTVSFGVEISF